MGKKKDVVGGNSQIFSRNEIYRKEDGPKKFHSFEDINTSFIGRQVNIVNNDGAGRLDHQGHIVPQSLLEKILRERVLEMAATCHDIEAVVEYITLGPPWMLLTYMYALELNIDLFELEEKSPVDKFEGFFSIIVWNPVNICRAPSDEYRNSYPKEAIDEQVAKYLRDQDEEKGVNKPWMESLDALIKCPDNPELITNYLNACCETLDSQLTQGIGYYQFPWEYIEKDGKRFLAPVE